MAPDRRDAGRDPVADALYDRAVDQRQAAMAAVGDAPVLDPVPVEPPPWHDHHSHPDTVDRQLDQLAGIGSTILVDDGRTLLLQKGWTDGWDTPGGAQEPPESLAECAHREAEEETNLDVELVDLLYTRDLAYDYGGPARVHVPVACFLAERRGGTRAVPWHYVSDGSPEITDLVWFGPDDLPAGIRDRALVRDVLRGDADRPSAPVETLV